VLAEPEVGADRPEETQLTTVASGCRVGACL
jgi:hypothetical protein